MPCRRVGQSGLILPAISLGLWYNFGDNRAFDTQREVLGMPSIRASLISTLPTTTVHPTAPPKRTSDECCDRTSAIRRELLVSTKAGLGHVAGSARASWALATICYPALMTPYAGSRLDYVDIFYSHRFDPVTPLDETVGALATRSSREKHDMSESPRIRPSTPRRPRRSLIAARVPLIIHQPAYKMLNRWIESTSPRSSLGRDGRDRVYCAGARPAHQALPGQAGRRGGPCHPSRPTFDDALVTETGSRAVAGTCHDRRATGPVVGAAGARVGSA